MLLSSRKSEDESPFSFDIDSLTRNTPRKLADKLLGTRHKAQERSSKARGYSEGLSLTRYDISAQISRRFQHS